MLGQEILVKAKVYGRLAHRLVVVQISDGIGQHVNPVNGVIGQGLCLGRLLASGLRLLVGCCRSGVDILNASLGTGIDVLDRLAVLRRQVVEFIGFVDNWRGLLANIILASAADRRRHARRQH